MSVIDFIILIDGFIPSGRVNGYVESKVLPLPRPPVVDSAAPGRVRLRGGGGQEGAATNLRRLWQGGRVLYPEFKDGGIHWRMFTHDYCICGLNKQKKLNPNEVFIYLASKKSLTV